MMAPKQQPVRSKALRDSARGERCTLRIPGVCCGDSDTVVLCHLPFGGRGVARKAPDNHAAYGCRSCHDALDGRGGHDVDRAELYECALRGIAETQARMREKGLVSWKGNS